MIMIDDELGLTSDPHNWILIEKPKRSKSKPIKWQGKRHFFPNLNMMSKFIADYRAKKTLGRLTPYSDKKDAVTSSYEALMDEIIKDLGVYLTELTKEVEK
jgi:hypothetical protein